MSPTCQSKIPWHDFPQIVVRWTHLHCDMAYCNNHKNIFESAASISESVIIVPALPLRVAWSLTKNYMLTKEIFLLV